MVVTPVMPSSSVPMEVDNEDSMDAPPSMGSTEGVVPPTTPAAVVKKVRGFYIAFVIVMANLMVF